MTWLVTLVKRCLQLDQPVIEHSNLQIRNVARLPQRPTLRDTAETQSTNRSQQEVLAFHEL
jgi:hypothetical protein